jgi:hypothetical protein
VGQGVDEARRQRELTKAALAGDLDRLEARVRSELDWRARLTRERGRIVGIGVGVVVVVVGASVVFIVRRRFAPKRPKKSSMHPVTLAEVDAELHELRKLLEKKNGSSSSLVQKAVLRAISAAGTAGGTMVAREMIKRQKGSREGSETGRGG